MRQKTGNKPNGKHSDAMNARVAESREDIAAFTAGLNELAKWRLDNLSVDGSSWHDSPKNGGTHPSGWNGLRHRLDEVSNRGQDIARDLADEIRRHPLIGGLAAFGLGFGIATLLFKRSRRGSCE